MCVESWQVDIPPPLLSKRYASVLFDCLVGMRFYPTTDVSQLSKNLHDNSKQYHWGTRKLNLMEWWKKYMPIVFVVVLVLFLAYMFFL